MNKKHFLLLAITLSAILAITLLPAIAQDVHYHDFADQRTLFGIPNFFNVASNMPYLLFGLMGCYLMLKESRIAIVLSIKHAYSFFFVGVALVCFGSGYYHLNPSNATLLWDRLPMTLAFMSFFTVIIAEYIHEKTARQLFFPLLLTGLVSVIYWYWSESVGQGDLRLYVLVQFLPIILMPLILLLLPTRFTYSHYYWLIIACYVLAKVFELADQFLFDALGFISGHSIKHLVSAIAPYLFYLALMNRRADNFDAETVTPDFKINELAND